MRVAIVHDWLLGMRGGERCLELILNCYPDAEIFTLFCHKPALSRQLRAARIHRSILGDLPKVEQYHRYLFALYPFGARNLSKKLHEAHARKPFDLVISVSHCAAKNVRIPQGVKHLCYCLTPVRYVWDQYDVYFQGRFYEPITRLLNQGFRRWDRAGASGVDQFVAISEFVASRIQSYYGRQAAVVYPPIDTRLFSPAADSEEEGDAFLVVNALVPYKNTQIIVEAFNQLPYRLRIVGSGPELADLRQRAASNIEFRQDLSLAELVDLYRKSKALVFAAVEDFGMTPVEMQACGRPVIAFEQGGVLETVVSGVSGLTYKECSAEGIRAAVREFMSRQQQFTVDNCVTQAQHFTTEQFLLGFQQEVEALCAEPELEESSMKAH